ncbi:hypothetical protein M3J09_007648 [Ascochyta lentis]
MTEAQHSVTLCTRACQEDQSTATGSPPHVRPYTATPKLIARPNAAT